MRNRFGFGLLNISIYIPNSLDIRELISVEDVLEEEELSMGPNGALVYCMEYLADNLEWLHEQLNEGEDDYFLFDCPGAFCCFSH